MKVSDAQEMEWLSASVQEQAAFLSDKVSANCNYVGEDYYIIVLNFFNRQVCNCSEDRAGHGWL